MTGLARAEGETVVKGRCMTQPKKLEAEMGTRI